MHPGQGGQRPGGVGDLQRIPAKAVLFVLALASPSDVASGFQSSAAPIALEEKLLETIPADVRPRSIVFSPNGDALAYEGWQDDRWFVWVGNERRDEFYPGSGFPPALEFSRDGRRRGYVAGPKGAMDAVVDGRRGEPHDAAGVEPLAFSAGKAVVKKP